MINAIANKLNVTEAEVIRRILDIGIDVIRKELEARTNGKI